MIVRIRVLYSARLIERDIAIAIDADSEHQLITGFRAAFNNAFRRYRKDHGFAAQRVGQARRARNYI